MENAESSALIEFIAAQQEPIKKGGRARETAQPANNVLLPPLRKPVWRLRLLITALLVIAGLVAGLAIASTAKGQWLLDKTGWTAAAVAPEEPVEEEAAAPAPCPSPAPMPAAAAAPAPAPTPVAAPPPPAPAPTTAQAVVPEKPEKKEPEEKDKKDKKDKGKKEGTLRVNAKPVADIIIDGKDTGLQTPQKSIKLKTGKHKVVLVNKQLGVRKKVTVRIKAGKTASVTEDLRDD